MDMSKKLGYRVLIEGTLTTRTFLHIGAGKPEKEVATARQEAQAAPDPEGERKGVPLPVVTAGKKPIIPASALRGALRNRLKSFGLDEELMGCAAEAEGQGKARRLFVYDAVVDSCAPGLEFDDSDGHVDGIAMTAISRWRRAPQDTMLRNVLAVPPGVSFRVRIGLCGDPDSSKDKREVTADEIAKVLAALGNGEWAAPSAGTLFKPLHLGAFQKAGWGELEWKTCKIVALTPAGLVHWLDGRQKPETGDQGWGLCKEKIESTSLVQPQLSGAGENLIRLPLTLAFESSFFTSDQRKRTREAIKAAHAEDQDKTPEKLARVMRVDGRAWLNGQSLKGALRSQFERILRTRGIFCCDPTLEEQDWPEEKREKFHTGPCCPPIQSASHLGELCFACQVFGNGGWASTIEVTPFGESTVQKNDRREFLAISRFTGGGVPGLKFSADVAVRPKLEGAISINLRRLKHTYSLTGEEKKNGKKEPISADAKLGALLHLFRDFAEGDIPVGAGRSKGFGKFTVDLPLDCCDGIAEAQLLILTLKGKHAEAAESEMGRQWLASFDAGGQQSTEAETGWLSPGTPAAGGASAAVPKQKGSYNPYHWVRAQEAPEGLKTKLEDFGEQPAQRHDVYAADAFCGEIVVAAKAVTPIFVGGEQTKKGEIGQPAELRPFMIQGAPAIPSTTLRGLLSSTYEIATASAMRVLEAQKIYSYRMALGKDKPFDFIGKVTKDCEGVIPWARRPGKIVPGWTKAQPPEWEPVRFECIVPTDVLPNAYCLSMAVRDMPPESVRKHEIRFAGAPIHQDDQNDRIDIDPTAKVQFHRLAEERWDAARDKSGYALQPYEPLGQKRGGKEGRFLLKPGDFIYFDRENGAAISRIALAQIWRDDVRMPLGELFGGKDLVPLHLDRDNPNSTRKNLTMAETAFGFVLDEEGKRPQSPAANPLRIPAYASKIVVSDATVPATVPDAAENSYAKFALTKGKRALKALSSPKPPSPAFYFDPVRSYLPTYDEISRATSKPRGRKMYLHLDWNGQDRPWESQDPPNGSQRDNEQAKKLQSAVQCVKQDTEFVFTISFDNLTRNELLALCYTLRPTPVYQHKLGMGKPLGLGSIAFAIAGVRAVGRQSRYTAAGFKAVRFSELAQGDANAWVDGRAQEWKSVVGTNFSLSNSLKAMETIGATRVERMQYPMKRDQVDGEWELFQWPSANRRIASQKHGFAVAHSLLPIDTEQVSSLHPINHPIPRTPSPCYVIAIENGGTTLPHGVAQYAHDAIGNFNVSDMKEAFEKIRALPADAAIYLITTEAVADIDFPHRCVRNLQLSGFDNNPTAADRKKLELLKEALTLGSR